MRSCPGIGWLDAYRALHPDRVERKLGRRRGREAFASITPSSPPTSASACSDASTCTKRARADLSDHSAMVIEVS